jgi:hypothetical protein
LNLPKVGTERSCWAENGGDARITDEAKGADASGCGAVPARLKRGLLRAARRAIKSLAAWHWLLTATSAEIAVGTFVRCGVAENFAIAVKHHVIVPAVAVRVLILVNDANSLTLTIIQVMNNKLPVCEAGVKLHGHVDISGEKAVEHTVNKEEVKCVQLLAL